MSFRGELREFELPDIMQLIASQQKAGWLKIISKGDCRFVFFRDGKITSTKNPAEDSDPLEEYISRKAILTEDQADRVAAVRRKTGLDVQDVLVKEGLLTADEIQEIFEAMVEQDIFDLMTIRSGTYEFETEERPDPLPEGALAAEIGPILMEGARKADEISEMRRALGPEDGVLVLTSAGREPEEASEDETRVLALVNGVRPIEMVLEESGLDRYTATRLLFDCARKGWVALSRARGVRHGSDDVAADEFEISKLLRWLAPVLGIVAASILISDVFDHHLASDPLLGEWRNRGAQMEAAEGRRTVQMAIEVYRVKNGSYPDSLSLAIDEDGAPAELFRAGVTPLWDYARSEDGESYVLLPAPPVESDRVD